MFYVLYISFLVIDKIFGNVSMLINGVFNVKEIVGGLWFTENCSLYREVIDVCWFLSII